MTATAYEPVNVSCFFVRRGGVPGKRSSIPVYFVFVRQMSQLLCFYWGGRGALVNVPVSVYFGVGAL